MAAVDWGELLTRHGRVLVLYARQWTVSHADAEDAVQAALLSVVGGRHPPRDPLAYLYGSDRNAALKLQRAERRRIRRKRAVALGATRAETLFAERGNPDEIRRLEEALASLPNEQREVVVLKVWGRMTMPQVVQVIGTSVHTASSRYRYALEKLRVAMIEECHR